MSDASTIENRVYLFKDLATAYVQAAASSLSSSDDEERGRALEVLAEIARISCIVADSEEETPERVYELVLGNED